MYTNYYFIIINKLKLINNTPIFIFSLYRHRSPFSNQQLICFQYNLHLYGTILICASFLCHHRIDTNKWGAKLNTSRLGRSRESTGFVMNGLANSGSYNIIYVCAGRYYIISCINGRYGKRVEGHGPWAKWSLLYLGGTLSQCCTSIKTSK